MGILEFLFICFVCAIGYMCLQWLGANATILKIALIAIVIVLVVLLLQAIGMFPLHDVNIPRVR